MRSRTIPLVVFVVCALAACKGGDSVKQDLLAYESIATENIGTAMKLRDQFSILMQGANGRTEAEVVAIGVRIADQLMPQLDAHAKAVEDYKPSTDPVRALHAKYLGVARAHREAVAEMGAGIERKDDAAIASAQQKLGAWRTAVASWETEWKVLRKAHGLPTIAP